MEPSSLVHTFRLPAKNYIQICSPDLNTKSPLRYRNRVTMTKYYRLLLIIFLTKFRVVGRFIVSSAIAIQ
jgi:hypothetical protein